MRLLLALILAAVPSVLVTLAENSMVLEEPARVRLQLQRKTPVKLDVRPAPDPELQRDQPEIRTTDFNWLIQAVNRIVLFVLFGWAVGKIYMLIRRWVAIFLGMVVITIFLLDWIGLIDVIIRYDNLNAIFQGVKETILGVGFVDFFAMGTGIWAGVTGFAASKKGGNLISMR